MTLSTYLFFDGECGDAFEYYKTVFGGDFTVRQTYADGPPEIGVGEEYHARIMHMSLPIGSSELMGSDIVPGHGEAHLRGNNFSISYSPETKAEADLVFAKLKEGGKETMPLQDAFWGSYFGMCTDRFGVQWMVNVDMTGPLAA